MKPFQAKCLDCMCWQGGEVTDCPITTCPLWQYRMGRRPASGRKRIRKRSVCAPKKQTTDTGGMDA
jgi:hypothetical protein